MHILKSTERLYRKTLFLCTYFVNGVIFCNSRRWSLKNSCNQHNSEEYHNHMYKQFIHYDTNRGNFSKNLHINNCTLQIIKDSNR